MGANNGQKSKGRIFYFDALRAIAIISVLLFHVYMVSDSLVIGQYAVIPSFKWLFTDFLNTFFGFGVPLFLMLSGALILGREWDIKSFLYKRIPRILIPFIFWVVVLSIFMVIVSMFYPDVIHTVDTLNLKSFLVYLYKSFMFKNIGFTPLWYVWMILGVYLILPVFNKWILNSDLKELEYFLVIWAITCIFDGTLHIKLPINLSYFTGPIGMVILGYYLKNTKRKIFNNPKVSILLLIVGAISLFYASYLLSSTSKMVYIYRYSILYVIEVTGIFTLFKNFKMLNLDIGFINNPDGIFRKTVLSIAKYSYGIYLIHRVFTALIFNAFNDKLPFFLLLFLIFIGSLFIPWTILIILNRIPYLNQFTGA